MRLHDKAQKSYGRKISHITAWSSMYYPAFVDTNGKLKLPLTEDFITAFLGYICQKRKKDTDELLDPPPMVFFLTCKWIPRLHNGLLSTKKFKSYY